MALALRNAEWEGEGVIKCVHAHRHRRGPRTCASGVALSARCSCLAAEGRSCGLMMAAPTSAAVEPVNSLITTVAGDPTALRQAM